jgi:hypothetical protein
MVTDGGAVEDQAAGGRALEWFASPPRPDIRVIIAVSHDAALSPELSGALDHLRDLLEAEVEAYGAEGPRISELIPPEDARIKPFPQSWSDENGTTER